MPHIHRFILSLPFVVIAFTASIADAQLLSERLVPPQRFAVPPLPMTEQPVARRPAGADKLPTHLWSLPFGSFAGTPTTLSLERLPGNWRRPVLDVPQLASEPDPTRPASPQQPITSAAFVSTPHSLKAHKLDRFPLPADLVVRAVEDPTAAAAHGLITSAVPLATPNSAPLLRLSIPDPFEHLRAIKLANPPADSDASTASQARPPLPQLSAAVPAK